MTATGSATGTLADRDTPAPSTIGSVAITSTPSFDADGDGTPETYLLGESIEVTVTWAADVVWDVSAPGAEMRLRLDIEGQSNTTKVARLVTGGATSGTGRSLVFRYAVGASDRDTDGVFPKPAGNGNIGAPDLRRHAEGHQRPGRVARAWRAVRGSEPPGGRGRERERGPRL